MFCGKSAVCVCCSSVHMESFIESSVFFEKADNTLDDISQKVCHDSDVKPRQYITVLKDCLCAIKELKV